MLLGEALCYMADAECTRGAEGRLPGRRRHGKGGPPGGKPDFRNRNSPNTAIIRLYD
jgi:hypothetical protein